MLKNKKAEAITISVMLLALLMGGIFYYESSTESKDYVADRSTKIVYNLKSKSMTCHVNEIKINKENMELFKSQKEAEAKSYKIDESCY